jgi:hypothetical protein
MHHRRQLLDLFLQLCITRVDFVVRPSLALAVIATDFMFLVLFLKLILKEFNFAFGAVQLRLGVLDL